MTVSTRMHYRRLWMSLGFLYIAFILLGSLLRVPEVNLHFSYSDKMIHFLLYFILAGWFIQLYHKLTSRLLVILGAMLLGLLIENLQGMTAYRSFDYADELANSMGAITAFLFANTAFATVLKRIDKWIYFR